MAASDVEALSIKSLRNHSGYGENHACRQIDQNRHIALNCAREDGNASVADLKDIKTSETLAKNSPNLGNEQKTRI